MGAASHICLVISSMGPGGAERVVSLLANYWVEQGRRVDIVTLSAEDSFYTLSSSIRHHRLGLMQPARTRSQALANNLRRISALRNHIKTTSPDVVISFMDKTNVLVLLACMSVDIPVLVSERVFPGTYHLGRGWELMRKLTYKKAAAVVAVAERSREKLRELGFSGVTVIPNPVRATAAGRALSTAGSRTILGVGRLTAQKGFDILIRAFAVVHERYPDWRLRIIGEGEDRAALESLIRGSGLESRVDLPGYSRDIASELGRADIFVLSSRNEGFPNALVEAMSAGVAVLATDCESGPNEIIRPGHDGLLTPVNDIEHMARQLSRLMDDSDLRHTLGSNARAVAQRFSIESITKQWDQLIERNKRVRLD